MDFKELSSELRIFLKAQIAPTVNRIDRLEHLINAPGAGTKSVGETENFAQQFWESPQLAEYKSRAKHLGGFSFQSKSFWGDIERKTTIDSTTIGSSTPGILVPERIDGVQFAGVRKIRIRDLIPAATTSNNAVEYVRENVFTNAAYPQVEDQNKGEAALTFVIASAPVRTLAHWVPASAQVLDDWDQLQNALNTKLLVGLRDQEDFELLRGDGTGQHLSGLIMNSTAYDTSKIVASDQRIDTLSEALEQMDAFNRTATGIILNPIDWRKITRIKTEEGGSNKGHYLLGSPSGDMGVPILWGIPVALSNAMVPGKFLIGDFVRGSTVFDRMEVKIDVSNQHSDFFIKNLIAIRCEERLALAVYRSDFFIYGSF